VENKNVIRKRVVPNPYCIYIAISAELGRIKKKNY
jgi:hypothetical protein